MGHYEDFFWEVTEEVKSLGLRKEFDKMIKDLSNQEEYRHKSIKVRWEAALNKIKKQHKNNK